MLYEWDIKHPEPVTSPNDLLAVLMGDRGVDADQDPSTFLHPSLQKQLPLILQLFESHAVHTALEVLKQAIDSNTPVVIHGDYDADGVCATAILWETLYRELDYKNTHPFIPHREEHGYGVSTESLDSIVATFGTNALVITVDCGITAKQAVEYGKAKGLNFIITDHHTIQDEKVPEGVPVLHTYELCGAGIAWAFSLLMAQHFLKQDPIEIYQNGLDLAALATIADIQSVLGYNRAILKEGLPALSNSSRVGLQELFFQAGIKGKALGTYEVGWVIAPRLNALGRLEHALDSVRLLLTTDRARAADMVQRMNNINAERQSLTSSAVEEAVDIVLQNNWNTHFAIVLESDHWHEGILGLIAGKLVERFYVPVIVLGKSGEVYKGSARSVVGCNIIDAITQHKDLLIDAGGHAMAAGLSIEEGNVALFREKFTQTVQEMFANEKPKKALHVDAVLAHELINIELIQLLQELAPHGVDNPRPLFLLQDITVAEKRSVGTDGKHLSLTLSLSNATPVKAIWFGNGQNGTSFEVGQKVDVVASLELDTYREPQVQLKVKDVQTKEH